MSSWLWWTIGTFGLGTCILAAVGFIIGWPAIIGTKTGRVLLVITTAGIGAVALYREGVRKGRVVERARLKARIGKEVKDAQAERDRIDRLSDADVDRELSTWVRDGG